MSEDAAWERLMQRAARKRRKPTRLQIVSALNTLVWLSEECDDGALRDQIAAVRHGLYDALDARERP